MALFIALAANAGMGVIDVIFAAKSGLPVADGLATLPADTELACLECFPNGLPFYLRRTATLISRNGGELTSNYILYALKKEPDWPKQIVPSTNFDSWLASRTKAVCLIGHESATNRLAAIAAGHGGTIRPLASGFWAAQLPAPGER